MKNDIFPGAGHTACMLRYSDMKNKVPFKYAGAMVLGMHDALVSLTGIIVGLVFALADRHLIITTGVISSVAASLSMAASSYLAARTSRQGAALVSGLYTGGTYMATSAMLLVPFCVCHDIRAALFMSFVIAVLVIFLFNCCITRDTSRPFITRFSEMLAVCTCVSAVSFLIGRLIK